MKKKTPFQNLISTLLINLANLLKVKTIITLVVVVTFCFLTIRGVISGNDFMVIATAVITYYFVKDHNGGGKPPGKEDGI